MEWIKIYYSLDVIDANLVKGLLESHDIQVKIVPDFAGTIAKNHNFQTSTAIPYGIYVPKDQQSQAEQILQKSS